jgi:hypothetical protein
LISKGYKDLCPGIGLAPPGDALLLLKDFPVMSITKSNQIEVNNQVLNRIRYAS